LVGVVVGAIVGDGEVAGVVGAVVVVDSLFGIDGDVEVDEDGDVGIDVQGCMVVAVVPLPLGVVGVAGAVVVNDWGCMVVGVGVDGAGRNGCDNICGICCGSGGCCCGCCGICCGSWRNCCLCSEFIKGRG
jgi:hypothetical protein